MDRRLDRGCSAVRSVSDRSFKFGRTLLWLIPVLFLSVFFFLPLGKILWLAGREALTGGLSLRSLSQISSPLWFTLWQAALSTLLTLLLGLPCAYVFAHYQFRGKRLLQVITTLPFILPIVVAVAGFTALLGPNGLLNAGLKQVLHLSAPPIHFMNTLWGILLAHVFYNTTIIIRVVGSAWASLDPRWEDTARVLGASRWQTLQKVTLPLLRSSILAATLLVFLFDFTSFGVILMIGGPTFATLEVAIYQQALNLLNLPLAGLLSVLQLICTFVVTWVYSAVNGDRKVPLMPHLSGSNLRRPKTIFERAQVYLASTALIVLLVSPLLSLIVRSFLRLGSDQGERGLVQTGFTLRYYQQLFINSNQSIFYVPPAQAVLNSLTYASLTVIVAVLLGSMTAYAMTRNPKIKHWLDVAITLPLGASAVTLGLGFIVTFNHAPFDVMHFPLLIPLAHTLVALPFTIRTIQPALASIPESIQNAASVLGASRWKVWHKVELPLIRREIFVASVFAFTISLGEFGATTFLARPDLPTLPVAIYRYLSMPGDLNYGQGLAMSTILLCLCAAAIFLLEKFQSSGMREI